MVLIIYEHLISRKVSLQNSFRKGYHHAFPIFQLQYCLINKAYILLGLVNETSTFLTKGSIISTRHPPIRRKRYGNFRGKAKIKCIVVYHLLGPILDFSFYEFSLTEVLVLVYHLWHLMLEVLLLLFYLFSVITGLHSLILYLEHRP